MQAIKTLLLITSLFTLTTYGQDTYIVTAKKGLNIRVSPDSNAKKLGVLPFKYELKLDINNSNTDIVETIKDGENTISGEWIKVELKQLPNIHANHRYGYIFDAYIKWKNPYKDIGHIDTFEKLPSLKFTAITEVEFYKTDSIPPSQLTKIEKDDSHFFIKTKKETHQFKFYKDYGKNGGWSGSEFIGYYPAFKFYAITNSFTSGGLGFGQFILIDSITNYQYNLISIGDGEVQQPIPSPNNDYLIYYYNLMYSESESFISLIKVNASAKSEVNNYLSEYKSYHSQDWKVEAIRWSNMDTCIIKASEKVYQNKTWIKTYKYFKTDIKQ
ncbi:SH3 domain-containing protein [Olleya sp. HaHaR_3_96]|uniref:SH3 domain-containing protein n=1 Tax=Olleya sp. HaHaR_3_96 TaxID=2745560 RepID=UPI001C4E5601|nr:SH3 domain-containing protein [Olleya sp. HaHaR_3_96]QXP61744.1 hypothetical protein H0I26_08985 [Olleya sp. HaHaR_3_96]